MEEESKERRKEGKKLEKARTARWLEMHTNINQSKQ